MFQRIIGIVLIVAILGVAAYDSWRYVEAQQRLGRTTYDLARWAGDNAAAMSRDEAARRLVALAAPKDVVVTQYGQTDNGIRIWTSTEVQDTLVAGIIANMIAGKSFSEATNAPFIIHDYREAGF